MKLKERRRGIGEKYHSVLTLDAAGEKAVGLSWQKVPIDGSRLTDPGVTCPITNRLDRDEAGLWRTRKGKTTRK